MKEIILFKDKYKIGSMRLKYWDYTTPDYYFVTICTQDRINYFGEVLMGKNEPEMRYSEVSEIAKKYWDDIPKRYPNVTIDTFQIMPNHIHGIVVINETCHQEGQEIVETCLGMSLPEPTIGMSSEGSNFNAFSKPIKNSLSMIINHYKGDMKKLTNKNNLAFQWQSLFYVHIVNNEDDLNRIRDYITDNPVMWHNLRHNPENDFQK